MDPQVCCESCPHMVRHIEVWGSENGIKHKTASKWVRGRGQV